jgi:type VI secretion system protein ImpL
VRWWQILLAILGLALAGLTWVFGPKVGLEGELVRLSLALLFALAMPAWLVFAAWRRRAAQRPVALRPTPEVIQRAQAKVKKLREVAAAYGAAGPGAGAPGGAAPAAAPRGAGKVALPWTIVVGPSGSGKTQLVRRSRLELPFTTVEAGQPEGELEGYLSSVGVVVELRGNLVTRERGSQPHADLRALLGLLRGAPVVSVMVVLDLARLVERGDAEVDAHAAEQRLVLEAVRDVLGLDPPVFVMGTHADLVEGHVLGFGTLSGDFRAGALGVELGADPVRELAPAWGALMQSLRALVRGTVIRLRPELRRMRLELPEQLARVAPTLERLVTRLVEVGAGGDAARVRGVFVGSAAQEGQPFDLVDRALAQRLGIHAAYPAPLDGREVRSFFLYGPLVDVALRPRAVPPSRTALRRRRVGARLAWAAAIAAALFAIVGGGVSFAQNRALVAEARERTKAVELADATVTEERQRFLRGLLELGRFVERLDGWHRAGPPIALRFGLYAGEDVRAEVSRTFAERMRSAFERPTSAELIDMFEHPERAPKLAPLYDLLTAYLMVTEHTEALDKDLAARAFSEVWGRTLGPEVIGERERLELVGHYVRLAGDGRVQWERIDAASIDTVRTVMKNSSQQRKQSSVELARVILAGVDREGSSEGRVPDKRLSSFIGKTRSALFEEDVIIAAPFTLEGWRALRERFDDEVLMRPWVLGHTSVEAMQEQLRADYDAAWIEAWTTFLRNLRWRGGCTGGDGAQKRLAQLVDGEPIFAELTQRARAEATFPSASEEAGGAIVGKLVKNKKAKGAAGDALEGDATAVERALAPWFSLVEGEPAPLFEYHERLRALIKVFEADAKEPGKHTKERDTTVDAALETARRILGAMGNPELARVWEPLLVSAIECASSAARQAGRAALQAGFAASICGPFNDNLLGRYPFAQSDTDASIAAVEELFAPGGLVWAYYHQQLEDDLQPVGEKVELKAGASGQTTPELARFYTQAYALCRGLFVSCAVFGDGAGTVAKAKRTFVLTPEAPSATSGSAVNVTAVVLEAAKKVSKYGMGQPVDWRLEWPFDDARLYLDKNDAAGRFELAATGPWALFRIMDRAKSVKPVGDGVARQATFEAVGFQLKVEVKVLEGRINPLFDLKTLRGMTCPTPSGG